MSLSRPPIGGTRKEFNDWYEELWEVIEGDDGTTTTVSSSGGVELVQAGSGISVTGTTARPIISATGGSGTGDVVGPASSTDEGVVRWDGTTGKLLQNISKVKIDDNGFTKIDVVTEEGLRVTSTLGAGTGNNLVLIETTNSLWDRPLLRIIDNSSAGGAANIRLDSTGGTPDIEFVMSSGGVVSPDGKFEIDLSSNGKKIRINSRNAADNSFEPILSVMRYADGGGMLIGGAFDTPSAMLETVKVGSMWLLACSTDASTNSGDHFKIINSGAMTFNERGSAVDSRFEGDTDANLFVTDGTNDRVNIGLAAGDAAATKKLNVYGEIRAGKASTVTGRISLGKSSAAGYTVIEGSAPGSDVTATIPAVTGTFAYINSTGLGGMTVDGLTFVDAGNIAFNTTTGTKIGTATTQKLGFWNKTPIVQPTTGITTAAFVVGAGTAVNDASTFGGYTLGKIAAALINVGILA